MEVMEVFFDVVIRAFNTELTVFGFTFSFLDMFIFSLLADLVGYVIYKILN